MSEDKTKACPACGAPLIVRTSLTTAAALSAAGKVRAAGMTREERSRGGRARTGQTRTDRGGARGVGGEEPRAPEPPVAAGSDAGDDDGWA